jgi:hypothetical protein
MLNSAAPTTKEGIEKYLGSGTVKGIGPTYAKKLVASRGSTAIEPDQFKRFINSGLFFSCGRGDVRVQKYFGVQCGQKKWLT